ncbi:MAG TPA: hypothetical protein VFL88_08245 [Gemmatimonadales bacterium]|jgi:hypothetical protein|nr:hypothetical protein [Gemmatimonadales bacterium]
MSRKLLSIAALGAVLALGACGDDNGPNGDTLSAQEQAALIQALSTAEVFAPSTAVALSPLLSEASVGSLGAFQTVGSQLKITLVNGGTSQTSVMTSLTGWDGLDVGAKTVDSAFTVASILDQGTFPSTVDTDLSSGDGFASYFDGSETFFGESGAFHVTSASFGATDDCPNISIGNGITACRIAVGTMSGDFDFTAKSASDDDYTRGNTSFSVPAVQLSITVDVTQE